VCPGVSLELWSSVPVFCLLKSEILNPTPLAAHDCMSEILEFAVVVPLSFRSTTERVDSLPEVPVSYSSTYVPNYNYVYISCTYVCDLVQMKGYY
jgi:hypothetical protein